MSKHDSEVLLWQELLSHPRMVEILDPVLLEEAQGMWERTQKFLDKIAAEEKVCR